MRKDYYIAPKGYYTSMGYMGYANGKLILFASESDYLDYISQEDDNDV